MRIKTLQDENNDMRNEVITLRHEALRILVLGKPFAEEFICDVVKSMQQSNSKSLIFPNHHLSATTNKAVLLANHIGLRQRNSGPSTRIIALIVMYNDINQEHVKSKEAERLADLHMRFLFSRLEEFCTRDWTTSEMAFMSSYFDVVYHKVFLYAEASGFTKSLILMVIAYLTQKSKHWYKSLWVPY